MKERRLIPLAALWISCLLPSSSAFLPRRVPSTKPGSGALHFSKWVKDPTVNSAVQQLVKQHQKRKRQVTETPQRFLEDGIEAIKRLDHGMALEAFEQAVRLNQTSLVWHHGAMLYYNGRLGEAVAHLDATAQKYEEQHQEPATEEAVWRAAAILKLKGPERAKTDIPALRFGGEKRRLMGLVHDLFRGVVLPDAVEEVIEVFKDHPYTNYDLYGNFYLGLYYDAMGRTMESLEHMEKAMQAPRARQEDVMYFFPRLHILAKSAEIEGSRER